MSSSNGRRHVGFFESANHALGPVTIDASDWPRETAARATGTFVAANDAVPGVTVHAFVPPSTSSEFPPKFFENEGEEVREKYWPIYAKSMQAAKELASRAGIRFYEIEEIRFFTSAEQSTEPAAEWTCDDNSRTARIAIRRDADPECLSHEVGHSFFHPSLLHDRHGEPPYGDKFCNAFRCLLHPEKGTSWMQNDGGAYDGRAILTKCPTSSRSPGTSRS